ncbi:hypothetical protein KA012_03880 [Candidatus Woesebacteria bacterium]|nr:hypothetical protein [Candidatus Woesebacteria bacterium]
MQEKRLQKEWDIILTAEGMPPRLKREPFGKRIELGDGLGGKTDDEENEEDFERKHSRVCPLTLGKGINVNIDQPGDNPVENIFLGRRAVLLKKTRNRPTS